MNKDKEVILGYLKWLANRLSASMATQLNGADIDEYLEQQVNSVDLADVGERAKMRKQAITVFELTKGFTGEITDNAMKTALEMADYVMILTNDLD